MKRWLWRRRSAREAGEAGEAGETLVELLISVAIMSIAVVAIAGALATAVRVSDIHRKHATAQAAVRAFAEALQAQVARSDGYVACADEAAYDGVFDPPDGFDADVVAVRYWSATSGTFVATCDDVGLQLVTIEVASADRPVAETLDVVLRQPCRAGDDPCA